MRSGYRNWAQRTARPLRSRAVHGELLKRVRQVDLQTWTSQLLEGGTLLQHEEGRRI
jgi:hypothetical protein